MGVAERTPAHTRPPTPAPRGDPPSLPIDIKGIIPSIQTPACLVRHPRVYPHAYFSIGLVLWVGDVGCVCRVLGLLLPWDLR
jgi:hypothetical protein